MSILTINSTEKPSIIYQEINKQEIIGDCSDSYLTFSLTGNGTFPLSMISNIEPGGGYVRLSTTNNIINHNGNMVNNVQFITGWTDPQGGSHSQQDDMVITVNGTENFYLEVRASEVCRDSTTNNMILLSCWNGQSSWSSPSATVSLESNGNLLSSLLNIKKLSPCDSISSE